MSVSKTKLLITADPVGTITGALFPYKLINRNAQILYSNQTGHMDPVNGLVRVWGYVKDADEWYIIDQFAIVADGPVAQFLTFPLDYDYIYLEEMAGSPDHLYCRFAQNVQKVTG